MPDKELVLTFMKAKVLYNYEANFEGGISGKGTTFSVFFTHAIGEGRCWGFETKRVNGIIEIIRLFSFKNLLNIENGEFFGEIWSIGFRDGLKPILNPFKIKKLRNCH